jgi:hypothetical protein
LSGCGRRLPSAIAAIADLAETERGQRGLTQQREASFSVESWLALSPAAR